MKEPILTPEAARVLNFVGLLALIGVLVGAYIYQFSYHELPCTLCLLQRLAMLGLAFGAALNLTFGPQPRYYGLCLISAVFGIGVAIRLTLLHINPYFDTDTGQPTLEATTNPPFGSPVFGLDLYVWGVVVFATAILAIGIALMFRGQFEPVEEEPEWFERLAGIAAILLFAMASVETVSTLLECGFGACPNDGSWTWWAFHR
jgi:disulfide bond formation protein DsbB